MFNFAICDSSVALHVEVCNRLGFFATPIIYVRMPLGSPLQKHLQKQPKHESLMGCCTKCVSQAAPGDICLW